MTDRKPHQSGELMIGPLTATEWASLCLLDDHPRGEENPLPACCANISAFRDDLLAAMRAGGDPDICWRAIASGWDVVESHLGVPITDPQVPATLRKIYHAYVAGRPVRDAADREQGFARMLAQNPDTVRVYLGEIHKAWDVDTGEGRIRAVQRIGGAFVAYVEDLSERTQLIRELAAVVGMEYEHVALVVDAMRCRNGLPWQPAGGARVP